MAASDIAAIPGAPAEAGWRDRLLSPGARCALPIYLLLAAGFVAPLLTVVAFSFATPRSFHVFRSFTLANYATIFNPANTVWLSFAWSLALAALAVAILMLVDYPIAFIRGGVLDGMLGYFGLSAPEFLYTTRATLFGMVYVYLPFMLFPMTLGLSTVPRDLIEAARDMGASRLQIWREIELPLAMPGILIGVLLTFVLSVGAVAEAKILGGQSIIVITHDIEIAFTYAQNWPLGSALAVLLMLVVGGLTLAVIGRIDLDRILGRR